MLDTLNTCIWMWFVLMLWRIIYIEKGRRKSERINAYARRCMFSWTCHTKSHPLQHKHCNLTNFISFMLCALFWDCEWWCSWILCRWLCGDEYYDDCVLMSLGGYFTCKSCTNAVQVNMHTPGESINSKAWIMGCT